MNKLTLSTQFANRSTELSNEFIDNYMPLANGEFVKVYIYLLRCISDNQTTISVSALADFFNQTETDIMRALKYWDKVGAIHLIYDNDGGDDSSNNSRSDKTDSSLGESDTNSKQGTLIGITFCNLSSAQRNGDCPVNYSAVSPIKSASMDYSAVQPVKSTPMDYSAVQPVKSMPMDYSAVQPVKSAPMDYSAVSDMQVTPINVVPMAVKTYSPSQVKELSEKDDFNMVLYAVSAYLGKPLSSSELSSIAYFYDTLHFPADLIDYLVEYCVGRDKKSMRYIEKVALAWADLGISTVAEAKAEVASHNETTYSVLNAFGITNRSAGRSERDFINKWTDVYCFSNDIIIEACNRTLKATHQPSFEYADSILSRWQDANVKTADDIKRIDEEYEQNRQSRFAKRSNSSNNVVAKSSNRFNNFHQRDTDIDSLESALLSNNG